jgi:hypothetical protein
LSHKYWNLTCCTCCTPYQLYKLLGHGWDCLGLYLLGEMEHVEIQGAPFKMKLLVAWHFGACEWSCLKMTQWVCLTFWCMWVIMLANDSMGLFDILVHVSDHACQWLNGLFDILSTSVIMLEMIWWGCLTFVCTRDPTLKSSYGLF